MAYTTSSVLGMRNFKKYGSDQMFDGSRSGDRWDISFSDTNTNRIESDDHFL